MLRKEQNDLLTQTGPGTPMGNMFRATGFPRCWPKSYPRTSARRCG